MKRNAAGPEWGFQGYRAVTDLSQIRGWKKKGLTFSTFSIWCGCFVIWLKSTSTLLSTTLFVLTRSFPTTVNFLYANLVETPFSVRTVRILVMLPILLVGDGSFVMCQCIRIRRNIEAAYRLRTGVRTNSGWAEIEKTVDILSVTTWAHRPMSLTNTVWRTM